MSAPLPKSCATCPSLVQAEDTVKVFKKSIGASMCGRYGHVLGKPGIKPAQASKLLNLFAEKCPSHGEERPPVPVELKLGVALPDPDTIGQPVRDQELVKTCVSCKNFVRDDVVADEMGWAAGLCAAKGKLILPHRQSYEARDCDVRNFGPPRRSTQGITLLPEFDDAFNLAYDPVREFVKAQKAGVVDPTEYDTDKPVTADEDAAGIRAWRKITDRDTGNVVHLPIYKREAFREDQQAKIPNTADDERPGDYIDHNKAIYKIAVLWTELDETPALWGQAGVGKTELFRHMAWLMQLPFERISITASTELDDLAGKMHFSKEKGTYFEYGRLPAAWSSACVICLDEPNVGPPDVWQFIRPLTDNSKQLVMDMNGGERIARHTDCYMGMAMNPAWDPKNVGTAQIGDADGSRLMHISMDLPPAALEREILRTRVSHDGWEIDNNRLDTIMAIAAEIRALCDQGTLPISWGVRPQIKVARATRWFDMVTAYRMGSADYLEPEAQDALLDIVRAHVSE